MGNQTMDKAIKAPANGSERRKLDAKLRRDMRAKAKRNGDPMGLLANNQLGPDGKPGKRDNLLTTYQRAEAKNRLLQSLGAKRDTDKEAQKAYKKLQNHWYNRSGQVGDWLCEGKPTTVGRATRRRDSKPLI